MHGGAWQRTKCCRSDCSDGRESGFHPLGSPGPLPGWFLVWEEHWEVTAGPGSPSCYFPALRRNAVPQVLGSRVKLRAHTVPLYGRHGKVTYCPQLSAAATRPPPPAASAASERPVGLRGGAGAGCTQGCAESRPARARLAGEGTSGDQSRGCACAAGSGSEKAPGTDGSSGWESSPGPRGLRSTRCPVTPAKAPGEALPSAAT